MFYYFYTKDEFFRDFQTYLFRSLNIYSDSFTVFSFSFSSSFFCRLPPPKVELHLPFRAHIFDSWYETHRGPVVCIVMHDGKISKGQKVRTYHSDCEYEVLAVGIMNPNMHEVQVCSCFKWFVSINSSFFVAKNCCSVYMLVKWVTC